MRLILLLCPVIFAAASVWARDDTNYCSDDYKCDGKKHYACNKKEQTKLKEEVDIDILNIHIKQECDVKPTVTPVDRGIFLRTVNDFRNKVAEGKAGIANEGSNIRQLTWDYELERFARLYGTNKNEKRDPSTSWVEICAKTKELKKVDGLLSQKGDIDAALKEWTKTTPDASMIASFIYKPPDIPDIFNFTFPTPPPGPAPGPSTDPSPPADRDIPGITDPYTWTMLAWAGATKLGCTFVKRDCHQTSPQTSTTSTVVLFCFMGSGVNTKGQPVFKSGKSCSKCPPNTSCNPASQWPKLCAAAGDPTKVEDVPDSAIPVRCGTFPILFLKFVVSWNAFINMKF